jgi:hypothetical protein
MSNKFKLTSEEIDAFEHAILVLKTEQFLSKAKVIEKFLTRIGSLESHTDSVSHKNPIVWDNDPIVWDE